jgi:hypothetical protein
MATMKGQRSSAAVDALRVRALRGDTLGDCSDSTREWVWRSLLKGVRRDIAVQQAGLAPAQVERALARIARQYQHRLDAYKAARVAREGVPRVVRPVVAAAPRRRWWPFGKRG